MYGTSSNMTAPPVLTKARLPLPSNVITGSSLEMAEDEFFRTTDAAKPSPDDAANAEATSMARHFPN